MKTTLLSVITFFLFTFSAFSEAKKMPNVVITQIFQTQIGVTPPGTRKDGKKLQKWLDGYRTTGHVHKFDWPPFMGKDGKFHNFRCTIVMKIKRGHPRFKRLHQGLYKVCRKAAYAFRKKTKATPSSSPIKKPKTRKK